MNNGSTKQTDQYTDRQGHRDVTPKKKQYLEKNIVLKKNVVINSLHP